MSTLKFWNKNNENSDAKTNAKNEKNGRNWLHAPDALVNGHIAYLVKFLGTTPVDQPKGIEVVKEAIRRLQFTQQIKKAEGGANAKMKKVEITISVDGVAVQEPRTNNILHQFPLHKISYCADEKGVKKFFSFIAKTGTSVQASGNGDTTSINTSSSSSVGSVTGTAEESHECFVFLSSKLASDITLTIGQAFDLAYRRFLTDSGKQFEISKLQSHNKILESTVQTYRDRLRELTEILSKPDLDKLLLRLGIREICEVQVLETGAIDGNKTPDLGIDVSIPQNDDQLLIETSSPKNTFAPIVPPRNQITSSKPSVGTKLEGLLLNSDSDSDFDPRAEEDMREGNKSSNNLFGFEPSNTSGQQAFNSGSFADGTTMNSTNHSSPPPLLAPPPKAITPRRTNGMNGSQDLFGADPFAAFVPITKPFNEFTGSDAGKAFQTQSFQMGSFEDDNQIGMGNDFFSKSDSARNPFLPQPVDSNKKSSNLFQKSSEMMMATKNNKYDVFKNDMVNGQQATVATSPAAKAKIEVNPDLFKDFATAAFSEFKIDKTPLIHEFSNRLTDQKNLQASRQSKTKNSFNIEDFSLSDLDPLAK